MQEKVVFSWLKVIALNRCKEEKEKSEENQQFSKTNISKTTYPILFRFGMYKVV